MDVVREFMSVRVRAVDRGQSEMEDDLLWQPLKSKQPEEADDKTSSFHDKVYIVCRCFLNQIIFM